MSRYYIDVIRWAIADAESFSRFGELCLKSSDEELKAFIDESPLGEATQAAVIAAIIMACSQHPD